MIRKYEVTDIEAVVSSWRLSSELAHPFLSQAFFDQEDENLRNIYVKFAETWVCEVDGRVVGFIALVGNEVGGLFLDPAYHGRGFGKAMVDWAVREKGHRLSVDVFKENVIGRHFYDSYGFKFLEEFIHEPTGQVTLKMTYEKC
jgi:putative acetyltransferase